MHWTNLVSQGFEKIANIEFPTPIQSFINKQYCNAFNINLEEFDVIESYKSLDALFTRSLVKMRSFDKAQNTIISPCDSEIMEQGEVQKGMAFAIKGMQYNLSDFVLSKICDDCVEITNDKAEISGYCTEVSSPKEKFFYVNFYLSPRDYHRFHAPCDLLVKKIILKDGLLLAVNEASLKKNENLFIKNKRAILECEDPFGKPLYFVAVGALNVGKIQINLAPQIANHKGDLELEINEKIKKGDEIGCFHLGSTIVLITCGWEFNTKLREKVLFAQQIAIKKHS